MPVRLPEWRVVGRGQRSEALGLLHECSPPEIPVFRVKRLCCTASFVSSATNEEARYGNVNDCSPLWSGGGVPGAAVLKINIKLIGIEHYL